MMIYQNGLSIKKMKGQLTELTFLLFYYKEANYQKP